MHLLLSRHCTLSFKLWKNHHWWQFFWLHQCLNVCETKWILFLKLLPLFQAISKTKLDLCVFILNFWRTEVLLVEPLILLVWTSGDGSSGFQSQTGQPYSCLVEAYILHAPWNSPLVRHPQTSWWGSIAPLLHHSVRPGRRSTDWAMAARF